LLISINTETAVDVAFIESVSITFCSLGIDIKLNINREIKAEGKRSHFFSYSNENIIRLVLKIFIILAND